MSKKVMPRKFSPDKHWISPRSVMAVAIGILVVALSFRLGWFGGLWHLAQGVWENEGDHRVELQIEINEGDMVGLPHEVPVPAAPEEPVPPGDTELFVVVETPPVLVGGLGALQENIRYPEIAKRAGIEGRVFSQFVVEKSGHVSNIVVTRGIGAGCDEEATRALSETHFEPGLQRGNPVRVKMSIPVTFRLE